MKKIWMIILSTYIILLSVFVLTPLETVEEKQKETSSSAVDTEERAAETEVAEAVAEREIIPVVIKTTSVEKDLKIKFVNPKNDKVITDTAFEVSVINSQDQSADYVDEDADGVIYLSDIEGGSYTIRMKNTEGFITSHETIAFVNTKIEYKVIDIEDEIKTEAEIDISKEDAEYGSPTAAKETKEPDEEIKSEEEKQPTSAVSPSGKLQKIDEFGQLVYSRQKLDKYGNPMYHRILHEPDADHEGYESDSVCDRCGARYSKGHVHEFHRIIIVEPTCLWTGEAQEQCECGEANGDPVELPAKGHTMENGVCIDCGYSENEDTSSASSRNVDFRPVQASTVYTCIIYDTTSAPVYDETSEPVYEGDTQTGPEDHEDNKDNKVQEGIIGIDVSRYQSGIQWKKVKNAGIDFVMVRCGYRGYGSGVLVEDSAYASHIQGAKAVGLRVGVYFFSQAVNEAEAVEEASMAVKLANKYGINMPIAIDSEYANSSRTGRADRLSRSERTKIVKAFCNTVASAGHTPMVYASTNWLNGNLNVSQFPSSYKIWVAYYGAECNYTGRYDIWQHTASGKVDGVDGPIDMNISKI
ncbi:MAG: GH25 family lysozyme [Lachnospiraceae bacterium]